MRGILLSIKPKWWELIRDGLKWWEIRLTMPMSPAPIPSRPLPVLCYVSGTGYVAGWFRLRSAFRVPVDGYTSIRSLVPVSELERYSNGRPLYAWEVDKPRVFKAPMTLDRLGIERPPMSWQYIEIPEGILEVVFANLHDNRSLPERGRE